MNEERLDRKTAGYKSTERNLITNNYLGTPNKTKERYEALKNRTKTQSRNQAEKTLNRPSMCETKTKRDAAESGQNKPTKPSLRTSTEACFNEFRGDSSNQRKDTTHHHCNKFPLFSPHTNGRGSGEGHHQHDIINCTEVILC